MWLAIGFVIAVLIGIVLGLIGGGGSILTLPLLHYFFGVSILLSTTYSLVIVGVASLVGVIQRIRPREIAIREGIVFAIPSTIFVLLTRFYVIPWIPEHLMIRTFDFSRDFIITSVFIILLLITAIRMLVRKEHHIEKKSSVLTILIYGALTGILAGLIGAGGGFIIVPILISSGLSTKRAIGTSMFIISVQSMIALIGDMQNPAFNMMEMDYKLLFMLSILTLAGVIAGGYLQRFVKGEILRKMFAFLLIGVSVSILVEVLT